MATPASPSAAPAAPGLGSRDFALLFAATVMMACTFWTVLSVLPLWMASLGTGHGAVGSLTGVKMAATVGVQVLMPWILPRVGLRTVFAAGAFALTVPAFAYPLSGEMAFVLAVTAVRGVGFGMVVVAGSALAAKLAAEAQRGRALGLYGVAVGLPQVVVLPPALWLAHHVGFGAVIAGAAALGAVAVPLAALMGPAAAARVSASGPSVRSWPLARLAAPAALLLAGACAMGGISTFLAVALEEPDAAPAAMFAAAAGVVAGRWAAGSWADRSGAGGRLALPGLLVAAAGMGGIGAVAAADPVALGWAAAAAGAYGLGFGIVQNETLLVMFRRAGPGGAGAASTVWNVGFDAGTGLGAVVIGLAAAAVGLPGAFAATAAAMAALAAAGLAGLGGPRGR